VGCTPGRQGRVVAAIVGALTLPSPEPVLLTVRQADGYASPADLVSPSVSSDGRYVAFASFATLVPADTNNRRDIYVLDRLSGTVTIESLSPDGNARAHDSIWPRIDGDGRLLVYETMHGGPGHVPLRVVVLRDRWRATTRILQRGSEPPDKNSREPAISSDGHVVVFSSSATNLGEEPDPNGSAEDVYAFETPTGRFERINITTNDRQPLAGASFSPCVSADGRYVAFTSTSDLDSSADTAQRRPSSVPNVYLRDRKTHVTRRISIGRDGGAANGSSYGAALSGDGRHVAFVSEATNLVSRDDNRFADIFLYDVDSGTTMLVSRSVSGRSANGPSRNPAIAANGNYIVYQSEASDLTCAGRCPAGSKDINLVSDVFLFDRINRTTERISTGRQLWMEPSGGASISGTGGVVAFSSRHPIDANDTANDFDLFVWMDRTLSLTFNLRPR
jgi:TolB protein